MNKLYNYIVACVVLLASFSVAKAQLPACSTYVFTASNETFAYLTSPTATSTILCDDCAQTGVPIGFSFPFCGNYYSTVAVHSNGYISLSNSGSVYLSPSTSYIPSIQPVLFPMWGDEYGASSGCAAGYQLTGTAPNRVWTMEWRNWRPFSYSTYSEYSMQVRLYEGSGRIQFVYKREPTGVNPLPCVGVGIAWNASDYQSLPNFGTSPIPSSTTFTTCISTYMATGQVYTWDPPTPCPKSTALTINSVNSQGAAFSWTGVSGAMGYDYAVDTKNDIVPNLTTPIITTGVTNGTWNSLTPSTTYYLHVRTRCSATGISFWDTVSFRTLPPCNKTSGFQVTYIDSNNANFLWTPYPNVLQYQYVVDRNSANPTSSTPLNTTTTTYVGLPDTCKDGTLYYVHIRSKCVANDSSIWSLDSFRTPVPCRKPGLSISYLSSDNSITVWKSVPTAYNYEYYLGSLSSLPPNGTPILVTYVQTPYLVPRTGYTISVRCNCSFYGVNTTSDWSSLDFTTLSPTEVGGFILPKAEVELFPNPVKETLFIKTTGLNGKTANAQLTDMGGRVLKTVTIDNNITIVNMEAMPAGVYLIKYQDADQSKILKFTKE